MQVLAAAFYQIMDDIVKYTKNDLEQLSYRILQQIAKSMKLPSNFKKIYLVQMVFAKLHKNETELQDIIRRVRYERQMLTQSTVHTKRKAKKKMRLQATEVSSSTNSACMSPPIDLTPKRSHSPKMPALRAVVKYLPQALSPKNTSDRVLRSYNTKAYKRPNYSLLNNAVVELVGERERPPSPKNKQTQISIVSHEGRMPKLNVTARCVVRQCRPYSPRSYLRREHQVASVNTHTQTSTALVPAKRSRTLSGIYPIHSPEHPLRTDYEYVKSIGFRRTDGKISKINALVQKPTPKIYDFDAETDSLKNVNDTIQSINSNADSRTLTNTRSECDLAGKNVGREVPLGDMTQTRMIQTSNEVNSFAVYYHKKIRAEQDSVRSVLQINTKRSVPALLPALPHNTSYRPGLPRINKAFSRFEATALSRPLYVQVDEPENTITEVNPEPALIPVPRKMADYQPLPLPKLSDVYTPFHPASDVKPIYVRVTEGEGAQGYSQWALESLYNLKTVSVDNARANTADNTHCVYTAPTTVTTAVQLPTATGHPHAYVTSFEPDNKEYTAYDTTSDEVSRLCDTTVAEQDMTLRKYHEALSVDSDTESQALTIPEMVEDALELISQDGDYMERIGMDVRMQCILCSWAGSKIILEYHIRKEHSSQIIPQYKNEWNVTYKLGSLVNQDLWLSHVSEKDNALYILSVKYEDPDCFMASLTTLCISDTHPKFGTITLYNKVTGEPYSWHGQIPQLPSNMPYENDPNCLRIELSKLELLPNSANLKLHNRELILNSPSKVVVGQPELNDIHIIIFIKIHDV